LMEVLAEFLGIKMGDDLIEDARGPILHGTNDVEQHATGDPGSTSDSITTPDV
jgi:hypothetical protein